MQPASILDFSDDLFSDPLCTGGKAANLGRLFKVIPAHIPQGFSLSAEGLKDYPDQIKTRIDENKYYAVRSSAAFEDGKEHSFAGQFSSFLGVKGYEDIQAAIHKCLESFSNERSEHYKELKNIEGKDGFSVFVQEMVLASKSGVLFSHNPISGKEETIINASYGLCDLVVEGRITPDTITINGDRIDYKTGTKKSMSIVTPSGLAVINVPKVQQDRECLNVQEIKALQGLSKTVQETLGFPIDMEWAIAQNQIYILQARPITFQKRV